MNPVNCISKVNNFYLGFITYSVLIKNTILVHTKQVNSAFHMCWLASSKVNTKFYHLHAANETKSHVKSLISDQFFWYIERNKLIFWYLSDI